MRTFIIFLIAFVGFSNLSAKTCQTLDDIRQLYIDDKVSQALKELDCRIGKDPEDLDSLRLKSDIYWWINDPKKSREVAHKIEKIHKAQQDDGLMIHLLKKTYNVRFYGNYNANFGDNQSGNEGEINMGARYWKKNEFEVGWRRETHLFTDGTPTKTDNVYRIGHIAVIGKPFYIMKWFSWVPDSKFLPAWMAYVEPHYVFASTQSDFGLGVEYRHYERQTGPMGEPFSGNSEIIWARAIWRQPMGDKVTSILRLSASIWPDSAVSIMEVVDVVWTPRFTTKFLAAGGQIDENNGIIRSFYGTALSLAYRVLIPLNFRITGNIYRSEFREENKIGIGFEYYL